DIFGHVSLIQARGHVLHRIEIRADAPNHEIRRGAQTYGRVTMNEQRFAEIVDRGNEVPLANRLFGFVQQTQVRTSAIEGEVDELARELSFMLFEFLDVGSQPQRSASGIVVLIALAAHTNFRSKPNRRSSNSLRKNASVARTYSACCCTSWQP